MWLLRRPAQKTLIVPEVLFQDVLKRLNIPVVEVNDVIIRAMLSDIVVYLRH